MAEEGLRLNIIEWEEIAEGIPDPVIQKWSLARQMTLEPLSVAPECIHP